LRAPYRDWVEQGRAVQTEIQATIKRLPISLRGTFAPLTQQASDLVADLETLAHAAQQMDTYLDGPHARRTAPEIQRLHGELRQCHDPVAREQFQQALRSLEDALADQKEIRTLSERAKAVATNINASLGSVFSEVIKQRYADLDTAQSEYDSAAARLQAVKSHVDAVQQVITTRSVPGE
jgi:DNA repair exonuclease SbcCD ATPase subunit